MLSYLIKYSGEINLDRIKLYAQKYYEVDLGLLSPFEVWSSCLLHNPALLLECWYINHMTAFLLLMYLHTLSFVALILVDFGFLMYCLVVDYIDASRHTSAFLHQINFKTL